MYLEIFFFPIEDEYEPLDTEEEDIVRSVAKKIERQALSKHTSTQNDRDIQEAEDKMDRIEYEVMRLHKSASEDDFSPVIADVKEARLMENFR